MNRSNTTLLALEQLNTLFIINNTIIVTFGIIGLLLNIVVCCILFTSRHLHQAVDRFITQLAISDLLTSLTITFSYSIALLIQTNPNLSLQLSYLASAIICKAGGISACVTMTYSNLVLVAISIERYRAIMYPFAISFRSRTTTFIISLFWSISIGIGIMVGFYYRITATVPQVCNFSGGRIELFAIMLVLTVIAIIIPLSIIIIAYVIMAKKILKAKPPMENSEYQRRQNLRIKNRNRRIAFLLLITVLSTTSSSLFIITNFVLFVGLLSDPDFYSRLSYEFWIYFLFSGCLTLFRCVLNPILYNFASSNFKKAMIKFVKDWNSKLCIRSDDASVLISSMKNSTQIKSVYRF